MSTYTHHDGPLGRLLLISRGRGLAGVFFPDHRARTPALDGWREDPDDFDDARRALDAYFDGEEPGEVALDLSAGTEHQRRVWRELQRIARGQTRSYGELARALGKPGAARAIGAANANNPISILVPCHRVIGADGSLTGYAGGEARKRWLLDHEGALG